MEIGNVRRIDYLGRIVIPMEIRRLLNLHDGAMLGISVHEDTLVMKKYVPKETLQDALNAFNDKFEFESTDLDWYTAREIEKRIDEIREILSNDERGQN